MTTLTSITTCGGLLHYVESQKTGRLFKNASDMGGNIYQLGGPAQSRLVELVPRK